MRLDQSKFRIFISHKHADGELACEVKRILEGLDPRGLVEAWVSGDDLVVGGDWNRAIKDRLAQSHVLLLLHTRPSYEWDWCLYETGLFTQFEQANVSGVVCIYDKDGKPPRPLSNLQGIRSDAGAIAHCLKQLFRRTWEVSDDWRRGNLDPAADLPDPEEDDFSPSDSRIADAAEEIAARFDEALVAEDEPTPPSERPTQGDDVYYPCHRVVLDFGEPNGHTWESIPEDAVVVEGFPNTSSYTLALFGAAEGPRRRTWGDLVSGLDQGRSWVDELDAAFRGALDEVLFPPGTAAFKARDPRARADREFRPVLYRIVRSGPDRVPVGATILLDPIR